MKKFCSVCVLMLCMTMITQAQLRQGSMGMGVSAAMPGGMTASVLSSSSSSTGSALGQLSFVFTGGSQFCYLMSSSLELNGGLGVGLVSYGVSTGTAPDSRTTMSIMVGARSFMKASSEATPYIGGNLSFTKIPTISQGTNSETSGSILGLNVFFGAQGNISRNVAVFAQMGIGYNSASVSSTSGSTTLTGSVNTIAIGGSAVGVNIYWD